MIRVPPSDEIDRIGKLPRRRWTDQELEKMAGELTKRFRAPGGTRRLWATQARVLAEAYQCSGAYAAIPVGGGKTDISFLLPSVLGAKRPLLLVPATLKSKTYVNFAELRKHYVAPRSYPVISLEMVQHPNSRQLLNQFRPDLIVVDESQNIASHKSARTRRIIEYINNNPDTRFVALSGSPLRLSVMDYWHLVRVALRDKAPLPKSRSEMERWAEALDVEVAERRRPGALGEMLNVPSEAPLKDLREAFSARMSDSWGFVSVAKSSCDMPIKLTLDGSMTVPDNILNAVKQIRETGETINRDLLDSGALVQRHIRELANGFFYFWDPKPPEEWLRARRAWNKFVRDQTEEWAGPKDLESDEEDNDEFVADSPKLVAEANPHHPLLKAWVAIKDVYDPLKNRTERWLSEYAVEHCIAKVGSEPTIVWVDQVEFGRRLAARSGWRYFGGGKPASAALTALSGSPEAGTYTVILSLQAHHRGHNLQAWNRLYYTTVPASVTKWEQSIGRVHRSGQERAVSIYVFAPLPEMRQSFNKALDRAKGIFQTTGQLQKLLDAKVRRVKKRKVLSNG